MLFNHDVIDLYVFDEKERKVAEFKSLTKGEFKIAKTHNEHNKYELKIIDPAFNLDFITFASGSEKPVHTYSDYELHLGSESKSETLEIGFNTVNCKLIAKTQLLDEKERPVKEVIYEMPNVESPLINITHSVLANESLEYTFNIFPYDDKYDKAFKMHIKNL